MKCQYGGNKKKLCNNDCDVCWDRSFASHEKSIYWNYEENKGVTPREISLNSHTKYSFICGECNHNFEIKPNTINTMNVWCSYCANKKLCNKLSCESCYQKSFASHAKAQFWHHAENKNIKPRDVLKNSGKKFWFTCEECKHKFKTGLGNINSGGNWCPYCCNPPQKICLIDCEKCFIKSFASHEKAKFWNYEENGNIKPREMFLNSKSKYLFTCRECKHNFEMTPYDVNHGVWCPYCASKKLCDKDDCKFCFNKSFASHPIAKFWNYEENGNIKPRNVFKNSHTKYSLKCLNNHSFIIGLDSVNRGCQCPYCKNKTEKMFADWLVDEKIAFEREKKFDWCINLETDRHLPFDFYLPNHNVIIEIDGRQHVEEVKRFKNDLQTIQERDNYKETLAIENGIHVIRICQEDIYYKRIDWEKEVLERLEEIKNKEPEIFCLHSGGFYEV